MPLNSILFSEFTTILWCGTFSWFRKNGRASNWQPREKGSPVQSWYVQVTGKEFLFGIKKSFFIGMRRFCFLSKTTWEIVIFVFIYLFYLCSFDFFFFHVIVFYVLSNPRNIMAKIYIYIYIWTWLRTLYTITFFQAIFISLCKTSSRSSFDLA